MTEREKTPDKGKARGKPPLGRRKIDGSNRRIWALRESVSIYLSLLTGLKDCVAAVIVSLGKQKAILEWNRLLPRILITGDLHTNLFCYK